MFLAHGGARATDSTSLVEEDARSRPLPLRERGQWGLLVTQAPLHRVRDLSWRRWHNIGGGSGGGSSGPRDYTWGAGGKGGSLVLESAWGDTISSLVATVVGPLPVLSHR